MTNHDRDLACRLFATATAMLEDATEIAVAGQSSKRRAGELVELTRRLQASAHEIAAIAETAGVVVRLGRVGRRVRKQKYR